MGRSLSGMGLGCGGGICCASRHFARNDAACGNVQDLKAAIASEYRGLTPISSRGLTPISSLSRYPNCSRPNNDKRGRGMLRSVSVSPDPDRGMCRGMFKSKPKYQIRSIEFDSFWIAASYLSEVHLRTKAGRIRSIALDIKLKLRIVLSS